MEAIDSTGFARSSGCRPDGSVVHMGPNRGLVASRHENQSERCCPACERVGWKQLYGTDDLVPLRELVQNASDAVHARSFLQSWPSERGESTVRVGKDELGHFLQVIDNGSVLRDALVAAFTPGRGQRLRYGTPATRSCRRADPSRRSPPGKRASPVQRSAALHIMTTAVTF
jgi:hypothetical protein